MDGLGRVFNVIHEASGVHIPLKDAGAITFVSFVAAGTQALTLVESIQGASEQNLAKITRSYKAPGIGGTWTRVNQAAGAVLTNADATNDCVVFTVHADQLSDGYDCVEVTAATGTCIAILHDLLVQRAPENLVKSVV